MNDRKIGPFILLTINGVATVRAEATRGYYSFPLGQLIPARRAQDAGDAFAPLRVLDDGKIIAGIVTTKDGEREEEYFSPLDFVTHWRVYVVPRNVAREREAEEEPEDRLQTRILDCLERLSRDVELTRHFNGDLASIGKGVAELVETSKRSAFLSRMTAIETRLDALERSISSLVTEWRGDASSSRSAS